MTGGRGGGRSRAASAGTLLASFTLVPLLVYLLSYGAFFTQHGPAFGDFVRLQIDMLRYQGHHLRVQPENSAPWTWPLLLHPIQYFAVVRNGDASRIVALGNPVLWWGFLASLPVAAFTLLRHPTWRDALIFGGYGAMFLPWLAVPRSQFIFYMLPAVPFMCLEWWRYPGPSAARRAVCGTRVRSRGRDRRRGLPPGMDGVEGPGGLVRRAPSAARLAALGDPQDQVEAPVAAAAASPVQPLSAVT